MRFYLLFLSFFRVFFFKITTLNSEIFNRFSKFQKNFVLIFFNDFYFRKLKVTKGKKKNMILRKKKKLNFQK